MPTVIVITCADSNRPGLTYKLDVPPWAMEEWYTENLLLKGQRRIEPVFRKDINTSITIIEGTKVQSDLYSLTWEQLTKLLRDADYAFPDPSEETRKQGRPEKRVLIMTTTRDRRMSSLVAKVGY